MSKNNLVYYDGEAVNLYEFSKNHPEYSLFVETEVIFMKMKKLTAALAGAMVVGMLGTGSIPAKADGSTTTDYVLTIPSTLSVSGSGWNTTNGISAMGTLADGMELTFTASTAPANPYADKNVGDVVTFGSYGW